MIVSLQLRQFKIVNVPCLACFQSVDLSVSSEGEFFDSCQALALVKDWKATSRLLIGDHLPRQMNFHADWQ